MDTRVQLEEWTAGHLGEEGDTVRLVKPLEIWKYRKEDVSWNIFRNWKTDSKVLEVGLIGEILGRTTFAQTTTYRVRFLDLAVNHIHHSYLEPILMEEI